MDFKDNEARTVFLRYALPCGFTLVKRGKITKNFLDRMIFLVSNDKPVPIGSEMLSKTAVRMCTKIAKKRGKKSIDVGVVRRYFLYEHNRVVDYRYKVMRDFDPTACKTYAGKVLRAGKKATVLTKRGKDRYRTDFLKCKKGDYVVVHRDFAVEKIDGRLFKRLWSSKSILNKANK